jgi:hypothetical protein
MLTLLRSVLQEQTQKPDEPVSNWLALLDTEDSDHTSPDFGVEILLIKVLLHLALALLAAFIVCGWFIAARFLDLPQVDYQFPLCGRRLLCIAKHLRDLCAQRCDGAIVWYLDCI